MNAMPQGSPTNPPTAEGQQTIAARDARQGVKTGHMRWVLVVSVILTVLVLLGAWFWASRAAPPRPSSHAAVGSISLPVGKPIP